jgi:hypothetical protein
VSGRPHPEAALRGFGPLVLCAVLFVLMVLLVPSNAPEQVTHTPVSTTTTDATTTTEAAP